MGNGEVEIGSSAPLGATVYPEGVNFSVFSKSATLIELILFDEVAAARPAKVIALDASRHRTYHYWHAFVRGVKPGQVYAYRAHGPFAPEAGHWFDGTKVLLDPYGLAVAVPEAYARMRAGRAVVDLAAVMKSVVADPDRYDWEGDKPLKRPFTGTVIYELHVCGFTGHPSSGVAPERRGTYAGLIEKIPYLRELGITAVELLPIFQFDRQDAPTGLVNYWGYQPASLFAPHHAYSSRKEPLGVLDEFRDMVKALHRAGIEVILDVVFNHTTEGGASGPTLCYRGFANDVYYLLEKDRSRYADYTGCGNTLNANHPIVRRLIQDSLRHWVTRMHVDGFRFDLASILSRDESGCPLPNPPILWDIESDPVLAGTKLIAEAWDAAGLYQVGSFVGDSWLEWNDRFRNDVRRFWRGENCTVSNLVARLLGSPDIYAHEEREPEKSVNFVTCHDGFTLNDLVSYDRKHNDDNGEDNRDGAADNLSWNCGVEGPSDNPVIEGLRRRQCKNFLTLTVLAAGTPMLLMGDEARRTQRGNNNAYCQDNDISWFDWGLLDRHADIHRFVRLLLEGYQRRSLIAGDLNAKLSLSQVLRRGRIKWHGAALDQPDWSDNSHSIAMTLQGTHTDFLVHIMLNAYWEALTFTLPSLPNREPPWRRWIDTALDAPDDICALENASAVTQSSYTLWPRSSVLLVSRPSRS